MKEHMVLWARFSPAFVKQDLIPEIEKNCTQFGIASQTAYDIFLKNRFAENTLYFHHQYAETNIPMGQEYEAAAFSRDWKIQPDSIQKCPSKVLCFFTAFRTQPSACAMKGHHELSLIQFREGVPSIMNELFEITEQKPLNLSEHGYIYLGSERELKSLVRKEKAVMEAAELLKQSGYRGDEDFYAQNTEESFTIYERIEKLTIEKYGLEKEYAEGILFGALSELWKENRRKQMEI